MTGASPSEDVERGPRCICGHYKVEHYWFSMKPRCHGAYATLAADADEGESVEVNCPCDNFCPTPAGYHELRPS